MPEPLTDSQRRVLDALTGFIREHGYPPTLRELAVLVDATPSTVHYQMSLLAAKGRIRRVPGVARGIQVIHLEAVTADG